jgi:hypothetical protein
MNIKDLSQVKNGKSTFVSSPLVPPALALIIILDREMKDRLASIKKRVKIKLMAYFAFRQRSSRGHPLSSLKIENCNLR